MFFMCLIKLHYLPNTGFKVAYINTFDNNVYEYIIVFEFGQTNLQGHNYVIQTKRYLMLLRNWMTVWISG